MEPTRINRTDRRLNDQPAAIRIVRARVIRWTHSGNACGCENEIVQLEGSKPRRYATSLEAKCGRCHVYARLFELRGRERWTIDPACF